MNTMPTPHTAPFVRTAALAPLTGNSHTTLGCVICSSENYTNELNEYLVAEFIAGKWTEKQILAILKIPIDAAALESPAALDSWLEMACNAINKTFEQGGE